MKGTDYYTPPVLATKMARWAVRQYVSNATGLPNDSRLKDNLRAAGLNTRTMVSDILWNVRVLDPACGEGDLLVACRDEMHALLEACGHGTAWPCGCFALVDIDPRAVETARTRLEEGGHIRVVQAVAGNSLVGIHRDRYGDGDAVHNEVLLDELRSIGAKVERPLVAADGSIGKTVSRPPTLEDVAALRPVHWGRMYAKHHDIVLCNPPWDAWRPDSREFLRVHGHDVKGLSAPAFSRYRKKALSDPALAKEYADYVASYSLAGDWYRHAPHLQDPDRSCNTGSPNLFVLFARLIRELTTDGAIVVLLAPSSLETDMSCRSLRRDLFETDRPAWAFTTYSDGLFRDVDDKVRFTLFAFERGQGLRRPFFHAHGRNILHRLEDFPEGVDHVIHWEDVKAWYPQSLSIPQLDGPVDSDILGALAKNPPLGTPKRNAVRAETLLLDL